MSANTSGGKSRFTDRLLGAIEVVGNKLPDPAVLFVIALAITWVASAALDGTSFDVPRKADPTVIAPAGTATMTTETIQSQLAPRALVTFLTEMVHTFTGFHPLGVVLVALLGVGVAERSGFINAVLKQLLAFTPRVLLTPMLILVAIVSHTAADAGYVLVIPLGGVIFYAAGRHPLAGIAAAFAGVSGGFSANFIPSGIDPLLQGITQEGAQILDPTLEVNPLCNLWFTSVSSVLIIAVGWFITDRIIEPRLASTEVDGDSSAMPKMEPLAPADRRGMVAGLVAMALGVLALALACAAADSPFRSDDPRIVGMEQLTAFSAPLMRSIVPLIFLLFLLPGVVHGYVSGKFKSHRDVIQGMSSTMSTMGYYLVMAFFASLFIYAFNQSNLGKFLAVKGAAAIQAARLPASATIVGIIILCATVNLLIGSASAKWALLAPIFVPMLMQLGISPELTQAAYRVGDSSTNIITPLMPYFPLVVAFCQRYTTKAGVGTVASLMLPYSVSFLVLWTSFLLVYWQLGISLGVGATYTYEM